MFFDMIVFFHILSLNQRNCCSFVKIQVPPESEQALMQRANTLAGLSLADVALELGVSVPANFKRHKGWTGQLIECYLGATAGSKPEQDFVELGIELKTLPLSYALRPLETTYVCYAPLQNIMGVTWQTSNVRNKLQKVLWIPIQGERDIPPAQRIIGSPIMWQPSKQQSLLMQQDWEELMDMIALGKVESITARIGQVLQLRPKAADGRALTQATGSKGATVLTRPRGFYLRKEFTQQILDQAF
ncbi:MAG: DNA mismatch repair protein MutH [Patiriisocius sp.]